MDVRAIVRHYTFSIEDVALMQQRRRNANRLGFAVHLAYLRFPGRMLGPNDPPPYVLAFIADQFRRKTPLRILKVTIRCGEGAFWLSMGLWTF